MTDTQPKSMKRKKKSVGASGRKEVVAGLCEELCDIVKDYDIESGDKSLPKVIAMLQACTKVVTTLAKNVKESHLTQKLSNELFYASMVLENEGKETLRRFMIKSMKGKEETKVLSLQKLYKMNAAGEGFLAKAEHVEQSLYDKKSLTDSVIRTTGPSEKKLRTALDSLIKEIGLDDHDGDYSLISCDYTIEAKENKAHSNMLQKVNHRKFKEDEASEQIDLAKADLKKSRDVFKGEHGQCPDQDDEEDDYNKWRSESDAACRVQIDTLKGCFELKFSFSAALAKVKKILDEKITLFDKKKEDLQARFPAVDSVEPESGSGDESGDDSDDSDEVPKTPSATVGNIPKKRKDINSEKSPKKPPKKHKPAEADEDE